MAVPTAGRSPDLRLLKIRSPNHSASDLTPRDRGCAGAARRSRPQRWSSPDPQYCFTEPRLELHERGTQAHQLVRQLGVGRHPDPAPVPSSQPGPHFGLPCNSSLFRRLPAAAPAEPPPAPPARRRRLANKKLERWPQPSRFFQTSSCAFPSLVFLFFCSRREHLSWGGAWFPRGKRGQKLVRGSC